MLVNLTDRLTSAGTLVGWPTPNRPFLRRHIGGLNPSALLAGDGDAERGLVDEWLKFASTMQVRIPARKQEEAGC